MIGLLLLLQGLIGLVVMLMFVGVLVSVTNGFAGNNDKVSISIPEEAALVLDPKVLWLGKPESVVSLYC